MKELRLANGETVKHLSTVEQGDVLFKKVDRLPKDAKPLKKKATKAGDQTTFALGEATGHHHSTLGAGVTEYAINNEVNPDERYFKFEEEADVTHQEHDNVTPDEGLYIMHIQQEYNHWEQAAHRVRD